MKIDPVPQNAPEETIQPCLICLRLISLVARRYLKALVLDEADKLLNMDFEKEINLILSVIPKERTTCEIPWPGWSDPFSIAAH